MPPSTDLPSIDIVEGVTATDKRAVAFLKNVDGCDIREYWTHLAVSEKRQLKRSMDYWAGGHDSKTQRHHGWDKSQFGGEFSCFHVFKGDEHRLYGLKSHPKTGDRRFEVCVLVLYYEKFEKDAPESEMRRVLRRRDEARRAAELHYAE